MTHLEECVRRILLRELPRLGAETAVPPLGSLEIVHLVTILERELDIPLNPMNLRITTGGSLDELIASLVAAFSREA